MRVSKHLHIVNKATDLFRDPTQSAVTVIMSQNSDFSDDCVTYTIFHCPAAVSSTEQEERRRADVIFTHQALYPSWSTQGFRDVHAGRFSRFWV